MNVATKPLFRKVLFGLIISLYSALSTQHSFAQKGSACPEDLVPKYDKNAKMWGYANLFGQWVINPIYTQVSPYVENKAVVQKGLSYGVIDCEGNVILSPIYKKLTNFRYGKIWAQNKDGMWGMLNEKGGMVLEHQYTEINPISFTELSWVKKDNLWGLMNEAKGIFVCKPQYKIAQVMSENATLVQLNEPTFGVLNHETCGYLIPHTITKVKKVAAHTIIFQTGGKWGVFDEWGKIVSSAEYDSISVQKFIYDGKTKNTDIVLLSEKNNLFGLISLTGKTLASPQYEEIAPFSNLLARVKLKGKYGYVNRIGKAVIKPMYEDAGFFFDGQAIVKKNGKYGVINFKNQFLIPANYSSIERNPAYPYYAIKENDKVYLYGLNGKKFIDESFESVNVNDTSAFTRVVKDGKTKFYNTSAKKYSFEGSFDKAESFDMGYAFVSNGGKWGVIDKDGKTIVPTNFEKVDYEMFAKEMVFKTQSEGKIGIINIKGKVLFANEYEMIVPAPPIYVKAKKGGKYAVLKNDGTPITEFVYDFISNQVESPGIPEFPAIVVKKEKYGLLNEKGEEIYQTKAAKIEYVGENNYSVKEKKACGLMNKNCSNEYKATWDIIREFGEGLAAVQKNNKWGYITSAGEEKIKPQFEDAGMFINHMAPAKSNGLWGIIDVNGKFMVQPEYDRYQTLSDGTRKLYKGDKEFTLMKGGVVK